MKHKLEVIPTDKPSRLHFTEFEEELIFTSKSEQFNGVNIYITSDEEIREGDWYLSIDNFVRKADIIWNTVYGKCPNKKIILTTDQDLIKDGVQAIDDEFLEWFVKNPSCEEIEIAKILQAKNGIEWYNSLNQNSDVIYSYINKIIIPKEEPKQYSKVLSENGNELFFDEQGYLIKEEAKQETLLQIANRKLMSNDWLNGAEFGAKWQQEQDKNKYSEEEVLPLLEMLQKCKEYFLLKIDEKSEERADAIGQVIEDFEQFKNK